MIWFWTRGHEHMELETRYDNTSSEFVVVIHHADGRRETERFVDLADFRTRIVALERELEGARWTQSGQPAVLPDGFPNRRLRPSSGERVLAGQGGPPVTRTYTAGWRTFHVRLTRATSKTETWWTVDGVTESTSDGVELAIPGMYRIIEATEDLAMVRACDCIDKWLVSTA